MKGVILFIVFCLAFIKSNYRTETLTTEQIKQIKVSAKAFMSAIALYSDCRGEGYVIKKYSIMGLQGTDIDGKNLLFNDLIGFGVNVNPKVNYNWGTYVDYIQDSFKNNIQVDFDDENVRVLNCVVKTGAEACAYAVVDKSLTFHDIKKTYTLLIAIYINQEKYPIKEVVSLKFYKDSSNETCDVGADHTDVANQISILRKKAEDYFQKKDYLSSRNTYIAILDISPNDINAKRKIEECKSLITYKSLLESADQQFKNKGYENAKEIYKGLLDNKGADKNLLNKKIKLCNQGINEKNYQQQIELADYLFTVANFKKSREYYNKALIYKPNDKYALSRIEMAKQGDKTFVKNAIARAVKLAESGKKRYAEAFKIMSKYEASGLLTTDNYAFLTLMMLSKNHDIRKELHYTNRMFRNYFYIYVKKLRDMNKSHPTSQATFLLENVINKRYQK